MVRQSDQEGTRLLSNVIGPGNRGIHAPNQQVVRFVHSDVFDLAKLT
jgi:hypothetical protein